MFFGFILVFLKIIIFILHFQPSTYGCIVLILWLTLYWLLTNTYAGLDKRLNIYCSQVSRKNKNENIHQFEPYLFFSDRKKENNSATSKIMESMRNGFMVSTRYRKTHNCTSFGVEDSVQECGKCNSGI